ncbi:MAG: dihydropyrimidinase [Armatimonadota bacterium]|nr:dihydropyrimidinase [Armatimonadota bacterium]
MRTVFAGGTIVGPDGIIRADLLVEGERIAAIGPALPRDDARVVDATGLYLLPGGIDVHTHLDMPLDDIASTDDFTSGHVAAAFGGTTSHIDFVIQERGGTLRQALDAWHRRAEGKACIDYGFHMTIADPHPRVLEEIARLPEWGISTVKVLMAYKGRLQLDDAQLLAVMRASAEHGLLTMVHCENGDIIEVLVREAVAAGRREPKYHPLTRPAVLEGEATARAIAIAAVAGAPLYVVHLTCQVALEQVRAAQRRAQQVLAETCIQYLFFTAADLDRPDFEGAKFVCSPPFRTAADQDALWAGLREGTLAVVSTDHCPFNFAGEKQRGRDDFTRIPNGVPAIEDRLVMLYQAGVNGGRIPLSRFVEVTATNPAKIFGLYPRKGILAAGSDADIVLWDPQARRTISARTHHMRVDYNLFEGSAVVGAPVGTWLRGRQIVDGERFLGQAGAGRFLHRARFDPVLTGRT